MNWHDSLPYGFGPFEIPVNSVMVNLKKDRHIQ